MTFDAQTFDAPPLKGDIWRPNQGMALTPTPGETFDTPTNRMTFDAQTPLNDLSQMKSDKLSDKVIQRKVTR